jgi:18S rRNA (adenine1779-N6/adenine1780-N6)-dimethyltransferase
VSSHSHLNHSNVFVSHHQRDKQKADQIIEDVVAMEQWKDKRASKLDLDDFLALLAEFNKRGIHFA